MTLWLSCYHRRYRQKKSVLKILHARVQGKCGCCQEWLVCVCVIVFCWDMKQCKKTTFGWGNRWEEHDHRFFSCLNKGDVVWSRERSWLDTCLCYSRNLQNLSSETESYPHVLCFKIRPHLTVTSTRCCTQSHSMERRKYNYHHLGVKICKAMLLKEDLPILCKAFGYELQPTEHPALSDLLSDTKVVCWSVFFLRWLMVWLTTN